MYAMQAISVNEFTAGEHVLLLLSSFAMMLASTDVMPPTARVSQAHRVISLFY